MSIMKSYLHELFVTVSNTPIPNGVTVRQIMEFEQVKSLVKSCNTLRIPEVDILVAIARGKEKSDSKRQKVSA